MMEAAVNGEDQAKKVDVDLNTSSVPGPKMESKKSLEAGESEPKLSPDKYNLVYFIMVLHGVGTLMYWNIFINAKSYFEEYKLGPDYLQDSSEWWYSAQFLAVFSWSSQIPNVLFSWINVFTPCGGKKWKRIVASLLVEISVCLLTLLLACLDTSAHGGAFFWTTMGSVVIMSVAAGFYQNCIYGIAARLDYVGPVVIGSNLCGVFTSVTLIIVLLTGAGARETALFYFGTSLIILTACLLTFLALPKFKFYVSRTAWSENQDNSNLQAKPSYLAVLKKCWVQCYNVFIVFVVTLIVFPKILADVKILDGSTYLSDRYFTPVACFLTFNVFAFLGNLIASVVEWPSPKYLWIATTSRVVFIPFFLLCNYHPLECARNQSSVLTNDFVFWFATALFGLSNGYFSSLSMTYCPRSVNGPDAKLAGMFSAAFLVTGVCVGVSLSYLMPFLVGC